MVKIATATAGAYLRYTLDGSTPTGGPSGNGTQIAAARGKVWFTVGPREKTLKAIAYKPGLVGSRGDVLALIVVGAVLAALMPRRATVGLSPAGA